MDTRTRASPAIEVDVLLPSTRVVAVLDRLAQTHGTPQVIYVDNGPECVAKAVDTSAHHHGVTFAFRRPGTPTHNPCSEACNGRLRQESGDQHWFASVADARTPIAGWWAEDNTVRPHTALQHQAPAMYTANWLQAHQRSGVG